MRSIAGLVLFFQLVVGYSQTVDIKFVEKFQLEADTIIGVDAFENYYYTIGNTFYKKTNTTTYSYANIQLGTISKIDITNPMKILVFYKEFNTVVLLDNRLNQLTDLINFSVTNYDYNVSDISISSNNNLWLYSLDDNVLTLWNYETKKTIFESQPLTFYEPDFESSGQISNYEYCWLVAKEGVLQFNEFGNFLGMSNIKEVTTLRPYANGMLYVSNNKLHFYDPNSLTSELLMDASKHKLENFFNVNEYLYFFNRNVIHKYSILKK